MQFSVIIPTRNREFYLADAVASALRQRDVSLEVLVVNDGTELSHTFTDARVTVLDNHQQGAAVARNLAIGQAHGRFIAFLDDDDYWIDTGHLARAAQTLSETCDFFFADGTLRYVDGRPDRAFAEDADSLSLRHNNTILMSTVCYKREMHRKLGLFDTELPYYYDWDWYLRLAQAGYRFARHPESVVAIRVHPASESARANESARRDNLEKLCRKHDLGALPLKNHADFAS
jgi:glycosyltransferase involved in cell wall biosynthesis